MLKNISTTKRKSLPVLCLLVLACLCQTADPAIAVPTPNDALAHEGSAQRKIDEARKLSDDNPASAPLKFQYAEALKKAGRLQEASREFLGVTEIDASYYIAYHQLTLCSPDAATLSEAVKRLTYLMADKPKDLMLRVALSELLECQREYFQAAKVLVDLVFQNAVPTKFVNRVNNRIRILQAKAREHYANRSHHEVVDNSTTTPLPLPEENLSRGLTSSRLEKGYEVDGYGHSMLQH